MKLENILIYSTLSLVLLGFVLSLLAVDGGRAIAGLGFLMHAIMYLIVYFSEKPRNAKMLFPVVVLAAMIVVGKFLDRLGFAGIVVILIMLSIYIAYHVFNPSYLGQLDASSSKKLARITMVFFVLFVGSLLMKLLQLQYTVGVMALGGVGLSIMIFFVGAYKSFTKK